MKAVLTTAVIWWDFFTRCSSISFSLFASRFQDGHVSRTVTLEESDGHFRLRRVSTSILRHYTRFRSTVSPISLKQSICQRKNSLFCSDLHGGSAISFVIGHDELELDSEARCYRTRGVEHSALHQRGAVISWRSNKTRICKWIADTIAVFLSRYF